MTTQELRPQFKVGDAVIGLHHLRGKILSVDIISTKIWYMVEYTMPDGSVMCVRVAPHNLAA